LHAKPIIMPWSPAPIASICASVISPFLASSALSTPSAMSGLCSLMETITPQVSASKPYFARV
jgi:hypothetical protein